MTHTKNQENFWSVTWWPIISIIILQKYIGVTHIKAKNQQFAQLVNHLAGLYVSDETICLLNTFECH